MTPARCRRCLQTPAGVAAALLALALLAPTAAATCGDYVVTRLSVEHHPSPTAPEPHKHCSGPLCSGAPAPEPPPTAPTFEEWGCPQGGVFFARPDITALVSEQSSPRPTDFSQEIFHPPRRPV
jgi:hypothetical protein